jgi:hypothetical protein
MSLVIDEVFLPATLTAPPITDEEFVEFCAQYPDFFIKVSAEGDILIMLPGDDLTSAQIGEIYLQLTLWSRATAAAGSRNLPADSCSRMEHADLRTSRGFRSTAQTKYPATNSRRSS